MIRILFSLEQARTTTDKPYGHIPGFVKSFQTRLCRVFDDA